MKIGFIGLGAMGAPMAASLQRAGHDVQACDLRRVDGFANWAASPALAAGGCELVFTSLPGPSEVEKVAGDLKGAMRSGGAWFDLSTNSPQCIRRLHQDFSKKGIQVLDAPVSGGPQGAKSGKLAIWVGGDRRTYEKLAHNCTSFAVQAVLAEVFTLGVKYDPAAFTLRLAHKDMSLALELAREVGVPMKIGEISFGELNEAMQRGWSERDCRVAMTLQEERAGVSVRAPQDSLRDALKE